jgi:hypothetical protein
MRWSEIRQTFPNEWLVVEALNAHTTPNGRRHLDSIEVVKHCKDGISAMQIYRRLHQEHPAREFYYVHTSREKLDIRERVWTGIRRGNEAVTKV